MNTEPDKNEKPNFGAGAKVDLAGGNLAKALQAVKDGWLMQTELIDHKALVCWTKYEAALAKGFDKEQALELCTKDWSL